MSKSAKRTSAAKGAAQPPFEADLSRLEELVARFERGDLGLEEALGAFEQGIQLTRSLMQRLDSAEKRIEVLLEKSGGSLEARALTEEGLEKAAQRGRLSGDDEEEAEEDREG